MADTAVAITAGTGTNIDTRTEATNGNHRQVVVLGDPSTNAGVAPVDATAGVKVNLGADNDVTVTNATAANLKVDGSDVTQPVSGTVTANLGATDNAVLDSIDSAVNGTLTVGSHAVTNAGTFAVQVDGNALTSLQLIDDVIYTDDAAFTAATSKVAAIGAMFDDTATDSVDEGDIGIPRMSADRRLYTDTEVTTALPSGDNNIGNVDIASSVALDVSAATVTTTPAVTGGGTEATAQRVTIANDSTGVLSIDDNGGSLTVDGTVTANLSATDNAVLDSIDTAVNGTLTVDLGANNDVTIDNSSIVKAEDAAHVSGDAGVMGLTVSASSATARAGTAGDYQPLSTSSTNGRLFTSATIDAALPTGSNVIGALTANQSVNVAQMNGVTTSMGNGTSGTGVQRVTIASDSTGQVKLAAGTAAIGKLTANSGVDIGDVDVTSISAGTNTIGAVVPSGHATAGTGLSMHFDSDGDNTAQSIKTSAGRLYFLEVSNPNSADAYIQLFDLATGSVTVGTTTPSLSLFVPAGDGTKDGAMDKVFTIPLHFGTAITYACTTTATGSGDPTTGLVVNAGYV